MSLFDLIAAGGAIQNPHATAIADLQTKINDALDKNNLTTDIENSLQNLQTQVSEMDSHINRLLGKESPPSGSGYPESFEAAAGIGDEGQRLQDSSSCDKLKSVFGMIEQAQTFIADANDAVDKVLNDDFSQSVEDALDAVASDIVDQKNGDINEFQDSLQKAVTNGAKEQMKGKFGDSSCYVKVLDSIATDSLRDELKSLIDLGIIIVSDDVQDTLDALDFFA